MRSLLAGLLVLGLSTPSLGAETVDNRDKPKHVGASFVLTTAQYLLYRELGASSETALILAIGLTLAAGIAKESTDKTGFDDQDMGANLLGTELAIISIAIIEF